jgi:heterodisulfide reductase subunit B
VLYFTQLMGLALDVPMDDLGLEKLIVDPVPVLAEKGLARTAVYL